jgi:hypothetical protein
MSETRRRAGRLDRGYGLGRASHGGVSRRLSAAVIVALVSLAGSADALSPGDASPFGTKPHVGVRHVEEIIDHPRAFAAPSNFWNAALPDTVALDAASNPAVANELAREATVAAPYVNTWQYTAPITLVPADQPLVPVLLRGARTDSSFLKLQAILASGMPIPPGWQPLADADAEGAFYQPDRCSPYDGKCGYYFEGWKFQAEDPSTNGGYRWSVAWGGRIVRTEAWNGHWSNWQYSGYKYTTPGDPDSTYSEKGYGATATSLPLAGGTITVEDVQLGRIEHAVGLAVIVPHTGFRWPAQRGDGTSSTNPVYEGMRLRFPPGYQPPPGLHPLARMLVDAIRDYGAVVWDKAGALSYRAEPDVAQFFNGTAGYDILDGFPWSDLKVIATGSDTTPNPLS